MADPNSLVISDLTALGSQQIRCAALSTAESGRRPAHPTMIGGANQLLHRWRIPAQGRGPQQTSHWRNYATAQYLGDARPLDRRQSVHLRARSPAVRHLTESAIIC